MKYTLLLVGDSEHGSWEQLTEEQRDEEMGRHGAFAEACAERDGVELLGGEALEDGSAATTMRTRSGELELTDGPFAEAAEQIGGFYVVEAPDLDTMIELARILPSYDIEIRPVISFD